MLLKPILVKYENYVYRESLLGNIALTPEPGVDPSWLHFMAVRSGSTP